MRRVSEQPTRSMAAAKRSGLFSERTANHNSSGARAFSGEMGSRCVFLVDQILCAGDEVTPRVRLRGLFPREMPLFTIFAPAAHVANGVNAALFMPCQTGRIEAGSKRNAIRTIGFENGRVRAIALKAFWISNRERNLCTVITGDFYFRGLDVGRIVVGTYRLKLRVGLLPRFVIVTIIFCSTAPGNKGNESSRQARIGDKCCVSFSRKRDVFRLGMRTIGDAKQTANSSVKQLHVEGIGSRIYRLHHSLASGNHSFGGAEIGISRVDTQDLVAGRILVSENIKIIAVDSDISDVV